MMRVKPFMENDIAPCQTVLDNLLQITRGIIDDVLVTQLL